MDKRHRPRISVTLDPKTLLTLRRVGEHNRIGSLGVVVDYVVRDWERFHELMNRSSVSPSGNGTPQE